MVGRIYHFKNSVCRCDAPLDGGYGTGDLLGRIEYLGKDDDVGDEVGGGEFGITAQYQITPVQEDTGHYTYPKELGNGPCQFIFPSHAHVHIGVVVGLGIKFSLYKFFPIEGFHYAHAA